MEPSPLHPPELTKQGVHRELFFQHPDYKNHEQVVLACDSSSGIKRGLKATAR